MTVKKFRFNDKEKLALDIQGHLFTVGVSEIELYDGAIKMMQEIEDISKQNDKAAITKTMESVVEFIDSVLEDGAVKKIFEDRPISIVDLIDLLAFLVSTVTEDVNNKMSNYSLDRIKG